MQSMCQRIWRPSIDDRSTQFWGPHTDLRMTNGCGTCGVRMRSPSCGRRSYADDTGATYADEMRAVRRDLREYDVDDRAPTYLVRVWEPPKQPMQAWVTDDWDVNDAASIVEVLDWAEARIAEGLLTEVFVRSPAGGSCIRVAGARPDNTRVVKEIPLVL